MKNSSVSFCGLLILDVGISQLLGGERRWHEAGRPDRGYQRPRADRYPDGEGKTDDVHHEEPFAAYYFV